MSDDWQIMSLKEANVSLIDCMHKTPPAADCGYPYVAIPQLKEGRVDISDARRISKEHLEEWTKKAKPILNDVILSRRCNPGETAFVHQGLQCALGQNLVLLRADGTKVYPPFLRWLVRGSEWWGQVDKFINAGAVFDSLKCADIPNFQMTIPSIEKQKEIAGFLGALDDKIELNRQINQTLEQIAQTIFKSWFVDFEPVKAKVEAKAAGRDPEFAAMCAISGKFEPELDLLPPEQRQQLAATAALFPDELVESELGLIPKRWGVGTLQDLLILQRGFDLPASDRKEGTFPVIAASGQAGFHDEAMVKAPGVVTGRSGVLGKVFLTLEDYWPLNTTLWVKEFRRASPLYAFHLLRAFDFTAFNAGSAVPTLNRNHIHGLRQLVPAYECVSEFEKRVVLLFKAIQEREMESQQLATLRDTLLPKLLSGELTVGGAA